MDPLEIIIRPAFIDIQNIYNQHFANQRVTLAPDVIIQITETKLLAGNFEIDVSLPNADIYYNKKLLPTNDAETLIQACMHAIQLRSMLSSYVILAKINLKLYKLQKIHNKHFANQIVTLESDVAIQITGTKLFAGYIEGDVPLSNATIRYNGRLLSCSDEESLLTTALTEAIELTNLLRIEVVKQDLLHIKQEYEAGKLDQILKATNNPNRKRITFSYPNSGLEGATYYIDNGYAYVGMFTIIRVKIESEQPEVGIRIEIATGEMTIYANGIPELNNTLIARVSREFVKTFNQACKAELAFRQEQQTAIQAVKPQPPSALEGYKAFGLPASTSQLSAEQPIEHDDHDTGQSPSICKTQ